MPLAEMAMRISPLERETGGAGSVFLVCLLGKPSYVAGPHPGTRKYIPRHFRDGFGQFSIMHGRVSWDGS